MKILLTIVAIVLLAGCKPQSTGSTAASQGIAGEVWWLEGDFMPRIGGKPSGRRTPVERELLIYPAINVAQTEGQTGPLFPSLSGQPVVSIASNESGEFSIQLPEGTYSVFTVEPNGFYANSFDGQGLINPVTVKKGEMTPITIEINYMATF